MTLCEAGEIVSAGVKVFVRDVRLFVRDVRVGVRLLHCLFRMGSPTLPSIQNEIALIAGDKKNTEPCGRFGTIVALYRAEGHHSSKALISASARIFAFGLDQRWMG